jgi:all-trans-retinol dehydrogenase (NAD+)
MLGGVCTGILKSLRWCIAPSKKSLLGQNVLITGGAMGLGRLMALRMAKLGVGTIVLWDINEPKLLETEKELKELGAATLCQKVDLSDSKAIYEAADVVKSKVGDIDVVVNNAGIVSGKTLLEVSEFMIQKSFEINSLAPIHVARAFLPGMMKNNRGHIMNVASSAGRIGVAGLADYCASKWACIGFDESLRFELRKQGKDIHTTVVCPYFIDTGMFKGVKTASRFLPILQPEYVADKMMHAILTNQQTLQLPRFLYLLPVLRLFPTSVFDRCIEYFGISSSMDEFTGHGH